MKQFIQISKLDAVKRQMETAIRVYFFEGDPVSLHTLTAAAYNVMRDVANKRGAQPMLVKDDLIKHVKPEYEKSVKTKINEAENFFKHADRDHEESLDFNPGQTEVLLFDVCIQYHRVTGEFPPLMKAYQVWFMANHQELFNLPGDAKRMLGANAGQWVRMGREGFFNEIVPLLMKLDVTEI